MKCEAQLPNRAKRGEAALCGRPATTYRMLGDLAWVITSLCDVHAEKIERLGYTLQRVEPADQACMAGLTEDSNDAGAGIHTKDYRLKDQQATLQKGRDENGCTAETRTRTEIPQER